MSLKLEGKTAWVTGAASGIGKASARRLIQDGALVYISDINTSELQKTAEELKETCGGMAIPLRCDVSDPDSIEDAAETIYRERKALDILVNAAGIVQSKDFLEVDHSEWDRIIDINQKGTAFTNQAAGRLMIRNIPDDVEARGRADRCYGKIVNFSSIAGRRGRSFQVHYAASKAAIISITQSAAMALAPYGINVNAVSPSVVVTPMWEKSIREKARTMGISIEEATEQMIEKIPLKRAGSVEDIAAAVSFLCSGEADFITGQTMNVDGGYEMN